MLWCFSYWSTRKEKGATCRCKKAWRAWARLLLRQESFFREVSWDQECIPGREKTPCCNQRGLDAKAWMLCRAPSGALLSLVQDELGFLYPLQSLPCSSWISEFALLSRRKAFLASMIVHEDVLPLQFPLVGYNCHAYKGPFHQMRFTFQQLQLWED